MLCIILVIIKMLRFRLKTKKRMSLFGGGAAAIMALVVGAMVYSVYCTALEEQRLYPAYYIEHDSDNNGQGEEPRPVV